jgi:hypothetical protein
MFLGITGVVIADDPGMVVGHGRVGLTRSGWYRVVLVISRSYHFDPMAPL